MTTPNAGYTLVGNQIKTIYSDDTYPVAEDIDLLGGFRVVATYSDLALIPAPRLKGGMEAVTADTGIRYQLNNDLVTWVAQPFSGSFQSVSQAIAVGQISTPHGLGATPRLISCVLVNVNPELNYVAGDQVAFTGFDNGTNAASIWANANNIGLSLSTATPSIANKTTGARAAITAANWTITLRAWI